MYPLSEKNKSHLRIKNMKSLEIDLKAQQMMEHLVKNVY